MLLSLRVDRRTNSPCNAYTLQNSGSFTKYHDISHKLDPEYFGVDLVYHNLRRKYLLSKCI